MNSYQIVEETNYYALRERIEDLMKYGWKPQGGVAVHWSSLRTYYYQAMVK